MTTKLTNSLRNSISEEQKSIENKKFSTNNTVSTNEVDSNEEAQLFSAQIAEATVNSGTKKSRKKPVNTFVPAEIKENSLAVAIVDAANHLPNNSDININYSNASMAKFGYNFINVLMKNLKTTNENFVSYIKQLPEVKNFHDFKKLNVNCLKTSLEQQTKFFNELKTLYTLK